MAKPSSNLISEQRRRKNMSQQQLADALGVHWTTISKLERGITKLDFDYAEKIAAALGVDIYDLLPQKPLIKIALSGYLHHGGDVEAIEEGKEASIIVNSTMFYDLDTFWLGVKKNALYPYFIDGDILGLAWATDEERRDKDGNIDYSGFVGRFCLVEDQDGNQFMGVLSIGSIKETVDLHNANYPPLRNIRPHSLGQVSVALMSTPAMRGNPTFDET